jgi:exosortase/archaeosortase family protein
MFLTAKKIIGDNKFIRFVLLFICTYILFYYSIKFITGIAAPGGYHSSFIENYFNIAAWLRSSLILSSKFLLSLIDMNTERLDDYVLKLINGRGIRIVYACLGFAVMSFWAAFITASSTNFKKKTQWLFGGLFILWLLNVVRISLVLIAGNKGWHFPFNWDHHTWFNIIAYFFILIMIFLFEKNIKQR